MKKLKIMGKVVLVAFTLAAIIFVLFNKDPSYPFYEDVGDSSYKDMSNPVNWCFVDNCHGLDVTCGPFPPDACTEMYVVGDRCLQYAKCETINGICQQVEDPQFTQCKSCVQECIETKEGDGIDVFECESKCG